MPKKRLLQCFSPNNSSNQILLDHSLIAYFIIDIFSCVSAFNTSGIGKEDSSEFDSSIVVVGISLKLNYRKIHNRKQQCDV